MAIDTLARGLAANTGGGGGGTTVDIEAGAGIRFDGTDPKTIINTGVVDVATPGNTGDDAQAEDGTLKISLPGSTGTTKKYVKPKGLNNAAFKDTDSTPTENSTKLVESGGVYSALGNKVDTSEKGAASGVATLDANGKLPTAQMPSHNHVGTEVTLTGYEKPSATDDIDPTDTVNQAIGKLEKALDGVLSDDTNYAGSNSPGGTATKAAALDVQAAVGSASKGVYINASGVPTEMTCSVETSVPQNAVFTDTTYTQGYGISIDENENNKITNTGVRSVDNSTGAEADGTFKVNENGTTKYIGIKGLNNAAFKSVDDSTAGISNTSTDNKVPTSKNVYDFVKGNSVTSVAAGAGLKTTPTTGTDGDPITTTGTVNLKLKSPTALSETAGNPDTSTDAVFPLAIDGAGNLATPVPMATTSAAGAVKIDTTLPADSSSISDNDVPTSKAVREAIEALPEPMVWKTGVTITADSTDTTKCSITIPASVGTVKEGYTFKITAIAQSPAYTGTLKVGDTLIADTENPTVTASWVLDTDWSVIPSGDEPSGTVTQVDAAPVTNSHLTAQITGGDAGGHLTETGTVTVGVESGYVIPPASSQQSASGGADLTLVTTGEKYIWDHKQDALTFDDSPTSGSNNPVKSGGVYTALNGKQDTISDLSTIRSGATAGATAVQPAELNDYVQNSSFVGTTPSHRAWEKFRNLVRAGIAPSLYPVGTSIFDDTADTTGSGTEFEIVAYNHHFDPKLTALGYTNSVTLLEKYSTNSYQYDAPEAFLYVTTQVPAGKVSFTIPNWDSSYGGNKTYVATLTNAVPVGGQITLLWNYNQNPVSISTYAKIGDVTAIETATIAVGDQQTVHLGTINLDATHNDGDYGKLNHIYRVRYGSNNYFQSGLRQYMNTKQPANVDWWSPTTIFDRPVAIRNTAGKLGTLNQGFVDVLANPDIVYRTCNWEYGAFNGADFAINTEYHLYDKLFLLSHTEVGFADTPALGTSLGYYTGNASRIKKTSATGGAIYWWLRTPYPSNCYHERIVHADGSLSYDYARDSLGCPVACVIQ